MKKIKILTIVLAIILLSMIGFFGIYTQVQNRMENQVKDYSYAMDINGSRNIILSVSEDNNTIIKDGEGNEVEDADSLTDEEIAQNGYTKEEQPINSEESKNSDNYKKTKEIIQNRLNQLGIDNYIIRLDEESGNIILETTEDDKINDVLNVITTTGKLEILDHETNEVLFNNDDIKSAKVTSQQLEDGTTIYLQLNLNEEGIKKLEKIKNDENTNIETDNTTENTTQNETTGDEETSQNSTEKQAKATLDGQNINEFSFSDQTNIKILRIPIGDKSTNTTTLNNNANEASYIEFMVNTKNFPLTYEISGNQYILSEITSEQMQIALYIALGIIAIGLIMLIAKHKSSGVLAAISYIGFMASFMLVIKYTNVTLSLEGFLGMAIVLILNYILVKKLLNKSYKIETYKEFFIKILPIIILSIVFCFVNWTPISSFAMVLFWGILLIAIYNIIVTSNLIKIKKGKENKK